MHQKRGIPVVKNVAEFKSLYQKRHEVSDKISKQQKPGHYLKKIDSETTLKLMDESKQNYQEFIKNRQLISRFDPNRKDNVVKKQLLGNNSHSYKDFPKLNIMKTQSHEPMVKNIAKMNFKKIFDQNLPKLVQESGLSRQDVINIYTRFVSIYMLQQLDDPNFSSIELSQMRKVDLSSIAKASKVLKLQSQTVVDHMLDTIRLEMGKDGNLSWEEFQLMITTLMPTNLED